jgi:adenylate cyclase
MRTGSLTERQLARQARSTAGRIRELVGIGVLRPDPRGRFEPADVQRMQIVDAYEQAGIELEHIAHAIAQRRMSFEYTSRIYPAPSAPSGRTFADLVREEGERGAVLPDVFVALGLPVPADDFPLTDSDERLLPGFLDAWVAPGISPEAAIRAARLVGETTRRAVDGWVALFLEAIDLPAESRADMSIEELEPRLLEPATRVASLLEPLSVWLLRRHLVRALNAVNVESMEVALDVHGLKVRPASDPPSIVFADMSGFTRLTEDLGDQVAAGHATALARMAAAIAAANGGWLVKQLGDGVMLAFGGIGAGVDAAGTLRRSAAGVGLPPLHTGISAGPVIERDGDYFGRTVNRASRISGAAGPGEILVDETVAAAVGTATAVPIRPRALKGLGKRIRLFRLDVATPAQPATAPVQD